MTYKARDTSGDLGVCQEIFKKEPSERRFQRFWKPSISVSQAKSSLKFSSKSKILKEMDKWKRMGEGGRRQLNFQLLSPQIGYFL